MQNVVFKKIDLWRDFTGRYLSVWVWGPEHISPLSYTLYTCVQYTSILYLFTQGRGGGELNQREA